MEKKILFLSVPGNYYVVFDNDVYLLHTLDSTEGISSAAVSLVTMVLSGCFSPHVNSTDTHLISKGFIQLLYLSW